MDGNEKAFVSHPDDGMKLVLNNPKYLYFDTNWWEANYERSVALKLQGISFATTITIYESIAHFCPMCK